MSLILLLNIKFLKFSMNFYIFSTLKYYFSKTHQISENSRKKFTVATVQKMRPEERDTKR
jgi:hypothetical protein